jgi:predicted nucleic acid-binding protein
MNVIDSSAWLSYFAGDKNSAFFAKGIEKLDDLIVPSITLTEVFKHILRHTEEESALIAVAHMKQGQVVNLDSNLAISAASYGVMYKLPLADSIIYATAQKYSAMVWTQDTDFKELANVKFRPKCK